MNAMKGRDVGRSPVRVEVGFWFVEQEQCGLMAIEQAEANGVQELVLSVRKMFDVEWLGHPGFD